MTASKSISKRMDQPHVPGTGTDYRTPVKLGTRRRKDRVTVPLLGQELRRRELQKLKDAFDAKDRAKANQRQDIFMEDAPIASSSDADDWQDIPDSHIHQVPAPPPFKLRSYGNSQSQGPRAPKKRNLREDAMQQYDAWKKLIPSLVKPMLDFLTKTSGKPSSANISMPLCNKCDGEKTSPVLCLFWDHYETIDLPMCKCIHFAERLIQQGFFPAAPTQPNLAISISFLEFYTALFERTGDAVTAVAAALSNFYERRGYPVVDRKGEPIADPFRKSFGAAAQWYDCLRREIHQSVEDAIEDAYINAAQGMPSQPTSSSTAASEPPVPNTAPTWLNPSATHAARLLQRRCPACFGGPMTGRSFKEGGDCHAATDCNFHQRHLKKAGDGTYFYDPEYFLSKEEVDAAGKRIEKARRRPPRPYRSKVPDAALDQCDDSHTSASANKAKTGDLFDDKGMGALVCRHDVPLFFVNIDTPGEQQKYAVALIDHLFSMLPPNASVVILYDIGCVLDRSIHMYDIFSTDIKERILFATAALHAYGHEWACQLVYNPRLRVGLGLTDGEGTERLWSRLRRLIGITRGCGRERRLWYLDRQAAALNKEMRDGLGGWIRRRQRLGIARQKKKAQEEFDSSGLPRPFLQNQWNLQQVAQLSVRAHAPARLKKELNMVLTLQGDIDTIEKTLQNTRRTVSQGEAPKDSIATISMMEQTQQRLQEESERLYASLNVHDSYPELQGMSLEFVRTLLLARDLKINIRKRAIASFFEWDKLDSAMGGKSNPLGTKIHQQVRKGITNREPALKTAIRKFNSYCDTLQDLVGNSTTPTPHHLPTKLAALREDPYLMEDVWIHSVSDAPPLWLTEASVRKGIRGMLKIDRCDEEQRRLGIEADGMCAWFGRELAAVTAAVHSPHNVHIRLQLQQRRDDILRLQHLWATSLVSSIPYTSHVNATNALANGNTGHHLTWLPITATPPSEDFAKFSISNSDDSDDSDTEELDEANGVDGMGQVLLAEALEEVGGGDDDDGEVQLSALRAAVWQTPPGLTYDYLTDVNAPASHLPATSSTSRLLRSTETLPSIYFDKPAIARLMNPQAMLNDTCMNEGLQLLLSHLQPDHADQCAIFSTYTMAYVKQAADDRTLWRDIRHCVYWEKAVWIIPIHLQHPYLHWTLCIINTETTTIRLFDSIADRSLWMDNVKDALNFIARMRSLAALNDIPFTVPLSDWTVSPISVDAIQSNSFDCGLWVLASALAVLRGFDASGLAENDMPWFRSFLVSIVMQMPEYPY